MKRSEMIKILHSSIDKNCTIEHDYGMEYAIQAEEVLKDLEEAGMKPPTIINPHLKGTYRSIVGFYDSGSHVHPNHIDYQEDYWANEWEPE